MKGMNRIKRGRGFRGVLNYIFGRDAEHKTSPGILLGGNMSGTDPRTLAQEFGITRELRPDIEKPVWHNSLRLPAGESLTPDEWVKVADDYMDKMGFSPLHPRCYVLHDDAEGQHIHIAASRIALDGTIYLGQNENLASTRIIQELEVEHGLTITKGPEYVDGKIKMPEIKSPKKTELEKGLRLGVKTPRLVLQELLDEAIKEPQPIMQFVQFLEENGVGVVPNLAATGNLNGFSFAYGGLSFKGSSLGDQYKWARLQEAGITYEQDRDFAELAKRKPVVGHDSGNISSTGSITGKDGGANSAISGAAGPTRPDTGSAFVDHPAIDRSGSPEDAGEDRGAGTRQGAEVRAHGAGTAPESPPSAPGGEGLEGRSENLTGSENQHAGADQPMETPVLGGNVGGRGIGRGLGSDDFGEVPVAWNSRFKKASAAKRRGREQPVVEIDRRVEFERLREAAHGADLVAYMQSIGLQVEKDGAKDWIVDDLYRITRMPDNHFVWCSWDQSRGGDPISFCMDEQGLSFQQAIADLSGGRLVQTNRKELSGGDRFPASPPICRNSDPVMQYMEDRGIGQKTIRRAQGAGFLRFVDYVGTPGVAFCGLGDNGKLQSMTVRLTQPIWAWDGGKEITKVDIKHSDKSFPALWRGGDPNLPSDKSVWIVEGGIDALAIVDWYLASQKAAPDIIVSGGAGVRSFLDRPHIQKMLKNADTVYVAMEHEKDQATQIKTDAAHEKQIDKICDLGCEKVIAWRPPVGSKDVAEAWKVGALPDAHDPLAHIRQESKGDDSAKFPVTPAASQPSTPRP